MSSRAALGSLTACAVLVAVAGVQRAAAVDNFWGGPDGANWSIGGYWSLGHVPSGERAVIGSTNPYAMLDGSAVISAMPPAVGGVALGLEGGSIGALTISAGTLNCMSAPGLDGRISVGVDGCGFLTMTGGTLTGRALVIGGEAGGGIIQMGGLLCSSLLSMSGSSTIRISDGTLGTADFTRQLRIEGPNVAFSTSGSIQLASTNTYTAFITSPTAHSSLHTDGAAFVGGALNVEFSGAGSFGHAYGQTWDLVDANVGVAGSFTNVGPGGEVSVRGLPSEPPVGAVYRTQKVDRMGGGQVLQLLHDRVLVLRVNRDTGEMSITNPLGGPIAIDAYDVHSPVGSLLTSYKGISGPPPGDTGWLKGNLFPTALGEMKMDGTFDLSAVPSVTLGTGFDGQAVAGDVANFGTDGEDLTFRYATGGNVVQGQVVYEGTKFENNLVLRVNPNTGAATLKNDSHETLVLNCYEIVSVTGNLDWIGWTGLGGTWEQTVAGPMCLEETNQLGSLTLAPGQEASIGDISASGFTTEAAQDGLGMQFMLAESLVPTPPEGDFNGDGMVDAADYTVWRDGLGTAYVEHDFEVWKANFGATSGPETTFRWASVVFDATLGAGSGSLAAAVPEPSTALLLVLGLVMPGLASRFFGRRRRRLAVCPLCGPVPAVAGAEDRPARWSNKSGLAPRP